MLMNMVAAAMNWRGGEEYDIDAEQPKIEK
jgi:hypothetical protein